jgi:hypothetical protein
MRWWLADKGKAFAPVFSLTSFLRRHQKERRRQNILHMRIVGSDPAQLGYGSQPMERAKSRLNGGDAAEKTRYMLCLSIVDTAESIIASGKPTLQYLTQAGDWNLQRKAKKRTLALSGQMRHLGVERLGPKSFRTCAVQDIGGVYGYLHPEDGKPRLESYMPNEILVDHNEAIHGDPRNRYRLRPMNKERLKELFPSKAKLIDLAQGVNAEDREDFMMTRESAAESVLVAEAWHLGSVRSGKDGEAKVKPGRHVLCISNADLIDQEYRHQKFPFADLKYEDQPIGYYGQSLVSRTKEAQRRVNRLIKKYERCQDLLSKAMCVVPRSSGLGPEQITNMPGEVVFAETGEPKLLVWSGTPPDLRAEIPAIREETLNNEGLSEQQVQGERIQGVNSAVGIRAADDVQSRRHVQKQRRYEQWHLDVAELLSRLNDDATEANPNYTVTSQVKRGRRDYIHTTKWKDCQIDADDARLGIFPTSSLSTTPKGRRDDVMGLLQASMISQQTAMELLDLPDLDTETANQLALVDYSRWQVEEVMDGEGFFIDPILGPNGVLMCLDTARKNYFQAVYSGAPEEVLDRLRDYMTALSAEADRLRPKPAAAPTGVVPPMPPPGMAPPPGLPPMPPPVGAPPVPPITAMGGMA